MNIIKIPALQNNYIWLLYNHNNECILIDPGEIIQILKVIKKLRLFLRAILLTHNHDDHVNGVYALIKRYPKITIFGPTETKNKGTNYLVSEGDNFTLLQKKFTVFHFPGHTPGHIGFYSTPWLFCGDTIFSAGCGTFNKKLAQKMYASFLKISNFPYNTLIFSGHEYTLFNIIFAISILPQDKHIINYYHKIIKLRKNNQSTIPTTLEIELKINLFLRCNDINVKKSLNSFPKLGEEWKTFYELRKRKNLFKPAYINI